MSGGETLISALEKRIADQRENGGDMLNYGTPNPLDVDLLAFIKSSLAPTPPAAASEVVREAWQGERPERICEAIAQHWATWEEDRAGTGAYTAEELAEDAGHFATGLYDALATLSPAQPEVEDTFAYDEYGNIAGRKMRPPTATHNAEALREALQTIADAEFVDVMCDPGWAIRRARSALDSAEVK